MPDFFAFHKRCFIRYESSHASLKQLTENYKGVLRVNPGLATRRKKLLPHQAGQKLIKQTSIKIQLLDPRSLKPGRAINANNTDPLTVTRVLQYRTGVLDSFGIDLFNIGGSQLDSIFLDDNFDGRTKFLREHIFLPKTRAGETDVGLWPLKHIGETLILNKLSQEKIFKALGRFFKAPFVFEYDKAVSMLSIVEQMFMDSHFFGEHGGGSQDLEADAEDDKQFAIFDIYV